MLRTEYDFKLPKGFIDKDGNLHKNGVMRLSTAADEILPIKDPRVVKNPAYLIIILLSRVITKLGTIKQITPKTIEDTFSEDLNYLQEFYNEINGNANSQVTAECPHCKRKFQFDTVSSGELQATP